MQYVKVQVQTIHCEIETPLDQSVMNSVYLAARDAIKNGQCQSIIGASS